MLCVDPVIQWRIGLAPVNCAVSTATGIEGEEAATVTLATVRLTLIITLETGEGCWVEMISGLW